MSRIYAKISPKHRRLSNYRWEWNRHQCVVAHVRHIWPSKIMFACRRFYAFNVTRRSLSRQTFDLRFLKAYTSLLRRSFNRLNYFYLFFNKVYRLSYLPTAYNLKIHSSDDKKKYILCYNFLYTIKMYILRYAIYESCFFILIQA